MHIAITAATLTPYVDPAMSDAALATAPTSLAQGLRQLGHAVTIFAPLNRHLDPQQHGLARRLSEVKVEVDQAVWSCQRYDGRSHAGIDLVLLAHELWLDGHSPAQTMAEADTGATIFAAATATLLTALDPAPDIVHLFGSTSLALPSLPPALSGRTVLSLDAASFAPQAALPASSNTASEAGAAALAARPDAHIPSAWQQAARLCLASPREKQRLLQRHHASPQSAPWFSQLRVMPEILDETHFHPHNSQHAPYCFAADITVEKGRCLGQLQLDWQLPLAPDACLLAMTVATESHPIATTLALLPDILEPHVQVVLLSSEQNAAGLQAMLAPLQQDWPGQLHCRHRRTREAPHQLRLAADLWLLTQPGRAGVREAAEALRYGAIPIAAAESDAGALVVDCDAQLSTGNAFVYDKDDPEQLRNALQRAVAATTQRRAFKLRQQHCVQRSHDLPSSHVYAQLYQELSQQEAT